jgi:hypothetical protein
MVAKCIRLVPPQGEASLGMPQEFHLSVGRQYVVFGIQFANASALHGTGTWLHLLSDHGHLSWAPISLFEIVDARVSKHWRIRVDEYGVRLWPESFFRDFYHDDLSEDVPAVVEDFEKVRALLEAETTEDSGHAGSK